MLLFISAKMALKYFMQYNEIPFFSEGCRFLDNSTQLQCLLCSRRRGGEVGLVKTKERGHAGNTRVPKDLFTSLRSKEAVH